MRHIRIVILALLLTAGASAGTAQIPSTEAESEFCLGGDIVDEASWEPLRGISVVVTVAGRDHVAASDSLGGYRMCALPQGQYKARAVGSGFYPEEREIWLDCFGVARVFGGPGELISGCLHEGKLNFYMRRPGPTILPGAADDSLGMPAPPALLATALAAPAATGQNPSSTPPIPPPGRMIDLGGWRLHLHCTGERRAGQPVVLLEAGAGGFSVDWSLVQPEVMPFGRICSYDRAGLGWSELGPHPRTLRQVVWELRELLHRAGETPPYLLVGHSYGGTLARMYALAHPYDVVGLVLSESGHERGTQVLRDGRLVRLIDTATGRTVPDVRTSGPLREAEIPAEARAQIEAAARAMAPRAVDGSYGRLPEDARRMRSWAFGQVKHWASNDNPFEADELAALLERWTRAPYPLGDLPVIVLSRGRAEGEAEREAEHRRDQAELLLLSRSSRQVIAEGSGHGILVEQPELVATAIRDVLAELRPSAW